MLGLWILIEKFLYAWSYLDTNQRPHQIFTWKWESSIQVFYGIKTEKKTLRMTSIFKIEVI